MGLATASTATFRQSRVLAAPALQFRTQKNGERARRVTTFAGVTFGAGTHAATGAAIRIDACSLAGPSSTFGFAPSWA